MRFPDNFNGRVISTWNNADWPQLLCDFSVRFNLNNGRKPKHRTLSLKEKAVINRLDYKESINSVAFHYNVRKATTLIKNRDNINQY